MKIKPVTLAAALCYQFGFVTNAAVPDWVLEPSIENGAASTSCTPVSGNERQDRRIAKLKANADLAQQFETTVWVRNEINTESGQSGTHINFNERIKTEVSKHLRGVKIIHEQQVQINQQANHCVMVAVTADDFLYAVNQAQLSNDQKQQLVQRFHSLSQHH